MAFNTGYQDAYQNGYLQNNVSLNPYAQPQYGVNQMIHTPVQNYMNPINQSQQQHTTGIIWVQGEAGAKAFSNVRPDTPVALWDSEEPVIYIKSVDATGKPSMTILDYTERTHPETKKPEESVEYATKEQVDNLNNQFKELSGHIKDIENKITSFGKPQQNNRRGNK